MRACNAQFAIGNVAQFYKNLKFIWPNYSGIIGRESVHGLRACANLFVSYVIFDFYVLVEFKSEMLVDFK